METEEILVIQSSEDANPLATLKCVEKKNCPVPSIVNLSTNQGNIIS